MSRSDATDGGRPEPSTAELLRRYIDDVADLDDWDYLCEMRGWESDDDVEVEGEPEPFGSVPAWFAARHPNLASVLAGARRTRILVDGQTRWLIAHPTDDGERILAIVAPPVVAPTGLWVEHAELLSIFGGFVDGDTEGAALANMTEAMTVAVAGVDMSSVLARFGEYGERSAPLPPMVAALYPIATEANGSMVMCDRTSGDLYVATHDPGRGLEPVGDVRGLYTMTRWPSFAGWADAAVPQL